MNILIVEDEARAARRLQKLIPQALKGRDIQVTHIETLGAAITLMDRRRFDLLFLDLNLNGKNGFDLLREIVSYPFHTIIVSAYAEKALEAFEYGVLDFVPKPVLPERLEKAIQRFLNQDRNDNEVKYLSLRKGGNIELLPTAKIKYIHAAGHYSEIYLENQPCKLHDKSLERLLMLLPAQFERIHKSYIVNIDYVKEFHAASGSRYSVELSNGETLPVGRSRYKTIKEKLALG